MIANIYINLNYYIYGKHGELVRSIYVVMLNKVYVTVYRHAENILELPQEQNLFVTCVSGLDNGPVSNVNNFLF